jgi:hypothetical protein
MNKPITREELMDLVALGEDVTKVNTSETYIPFRYILVK